MLVEADALPVLQNLMQHFLANMHQTTIYWASFSSDELIICPHREIIKTADLGSESGVASAASGIDDGHNHERHPNGTAKSRALQTALACSQR